MIKLRVCALLVCAALLGGRCWCATPADTVQVVSACPAEEFRWNKLILPGTLIALGGFGVGNGWFKSVNRHVRGDMSLLRGGCYFHADDYLQYAPAAAFIGLGFVHGAGPKHSFNERMCVGLSAYAVMALAVNITKVAVREPRPDSGARNSFPSGHTATAFTGAELMRLEYGVWGGVAGYSVATWVAFLRLYNNRHWVNDVLAGAGIGILSANVGYWLLPWERRLLKIKKQDDVAILPYASNRNFGFAFMVTF